MSLLRVVLIHHRVEVCQQEASGKSQQQPRVLEVWNFTVGDIHSLERDGLSSCIFHETPWVFCDAPNNLAKYGID